MGAIKEQFRWGDADEEDEGLENVLPPTQVIGPDEKGIKIVIEWRIDDAGQKIKTTKRIRVKKQIKKLKPEVIRRRGLKKFGDASNQVGTGNFTMVSTEEIFLERPNAANAGKADDPSGVSELASIGSASLVICRLCGKKGDHWTTKCPFRDLAATKGMTFGEKLEEETDAPSVSASAGAGAAASGGSKSSSSSYVPPWMRAGAAGKDSGASGGGEAGPGAGSGRGPRGGRENENSIRVTNLSEDTREADLMELFSPFGSISRIYIAYDRETGQSRGFAFINFVNREDAARAIAKLDKYGYDNLILRVEWATPKAERPS